MRHLLFLPALALVAGCTIPYATPEQTLAVPYATFVPAAASGTTLPLVPPFADVAAPAVNFPVPPEARSVKLETLVMTLRLKNNGGLPLRVSIYLGPTREGVYAQAPLGGADGVFVLGAGVTVEKSAPIDVALLKSEQLWLGTKVGSDGSATPTTIRDTDRLEVAYKVSGQAKVP